MLTFRIVGGWSVTAGERPIRLPARKDRALLAYLALSPGRGHARDRLAQLFWGQQDGDARHSLRQSLFSITRAIGHAMCCDREEVALDPRQVTVDALRLRAQFLSESLRDIEAASESYSGPLLEGIEPVSSAFDDWLTLERTRFAAAALVGYRRLLDSYSAMGKPERAIPAASRLVESEPFDEEARRELMLLHAECGQTRAAIAQYETYAALLRKELGSEPQDATKQIYRRLVDGQTPARRAREAILGRYAFALEQMPDCVIVTDLDGRIVGWNDWAKRNFGYERGEVLGRRPAFLYGPDGEERLTMNLIAKAVSSGRWSGMLRLFNKDGSSRLLKRTMMPLRDESDRPIGVFGISL